MNKNVIELNGKRYDALSGALLGVTRKTGGPTLSPQQRGKLIDGIMRSAKVSTATILPKLTTIAAKSNTVTKPSLMDVRPLKPGQGRRRAVSKTATVAQKVAPVVVQHSAELVEPVTAPDTTPPVADTAEPKADRKLLPAATKTRATPPAKTSTDSPAHILGHDRVSVPIAAHQPHHSTTLMRHSVRKPSMKIKPAIKPQAPVAVAATPASSLIMPKHAAVSIHPSRMARAQQTKTHSAVSHFLPWRANDGKSQFEATAPHVTVKAAPVAPAHAAKATHHTDIFTAAMARATSHEQPPHRLSRSRRAKILNALAGSAAFVVIAAFIAVLNMPNIQLHVASIQAGFKANTPSYIPAGYAMTGGVKRTGDTISMVFRAGTNSYTLTQQPSNWDDQTLLDNTLALQSTHQTVQAGGHTIYVYNNGNGAVWLNGDVRYDVVGNAPLDTTDISELAMSL